MTDSQLEEHYGSKPPSKKRARGSTEDPFETYELCETSAKFIPQDSLATNKAPIFGHQSLLAFMAYPSTAAFSNNSTFNHLKLSGDEMTNPNLGDSTFLDIKTDIQNLTGPNANNDKMMVPLALYDDNYTNYLTIEEYQESFHFNDSEIDGNSFSNTAPSLLNTEVNATNILQANRPPTNINQNTDSSCIRQDQNDDTKCSIQTKERPSNPILSPQNDNSNYYKVNNNSNFSTVSLQVSTSAPSSEASPLPTISTVLFTQPKTANITYTLLLEQIQKFQMSKVTTFRMSG
jgi:hypothetical protein